MRKFIIISLLSAMTMPTLACIWGELTNPYLFSMYRKTEFKERVEKICNDNWQAYLGTSEEYFWFNADDVIKAAQHKSDGLMVSYVKNLQKYLKCVGVEQSKQYEWNYPSKEEIATQQRDLQAIRTYALGNTKTKLRSQHALLYMRCNMMLGRHQENINYWEQTASQFIETVYKLRESDDPVLPQAFLPGHPSALSEEPQLKGAAFPVTGFCQQLSGGDRC